MMPDREPIFPLKNAYQDFVEIIFSLSNERFLSPMDGGWSPRDVVAHLIGWNSLMIEASSSILGGKAPAYYADSTNDYSNINSGFTAKYSSQSKQELLEELKSSMAGLEAFVIALPDAELTAHHGVRHYRGTPATVSKIITSLAGDYQFHTREIKEWLGKN